MFRLGVVNPTSMKDKVSEFVSLQADVFAISETSATKLVQSSMTPKLAEVVQDAGFRTHSAIIASFWFVYGQFWS